MPSLVTTRVIYSLDLLLVPEVGLGVDALFIHSVILVEDGEEARTVEAGRPLVRQWVVVQTGGRGVY